MPVTDPAAWDQVEQAIWYWISQCTGIAADRVRNPQPREFGEARGPAPKAVLRLLSLVPNSQPMTTPLPQIKVQRYTVIANGPGEVGVDFYPDVSETQQRISIIAGVGDPPNVSAAALLAQLQADLPAGYSAVIDPEDDTSIRVSGSAAEPLFASATADAALLTVTTAMPRFPDLITVRVTPVWRIEFRANDVNGLGIAANAMSKAMVYRRTLLDPTMVRLGFYPAGTPFTEAEIPTERDESLAVLDVQYVGHLTGAVANVAMRQVGLTQTAAAA